MGREMTEEISSGPKATNQNVITDHKNESKAEKLNAKGLVSGSEEPANVSKM